MLLFVISLNPVLQMNNLEGFLLFFFFFKEKKPFSQLGIKQVLSKSSRSLIISVLSMVAQCDTEQCGVRCGCREQKIKKTVSFKKIAGRNGMPLRANRPAVPQRSDTMMTFIEN